MKPSFKWSLVTGRDYGRANAWAKAQPLNPINAAIRAALCCSAPLRETSGK